MLELKRLKSEFDPSSYEKVPFLLFQTMRASKRKRTNDFRTANDLSGLVRKKKTVEAASNGTASSNSKRKAEDDAEEASDTAKKAKVESVPEEL